MIQVVSAIEKPVVVKVSARKPLVQGARETVYPPRRVELRFGVPTELSQAEAELVLKQYARRGVVLVRADESPEEAIDRAIETRTSFLEASLNNFREANALRRAQNIEPLIPRTRHREELRELKKLRTRVLDSADAELMGPPTKPIEDVALTGEDRDLGLTPAMMALVPGISADVSGITASEEIPDLPL